MEFLVPILEKFGPTGVTIVVLGGGVIWFARWLREMQADSRAQHDKERKEFAEILREKRADYMGELQRERTDFLDAIKLQRADSERTITGIVQRFEVSLHEIAEDLQGVKGEVGKLTDKVDQLRK